jgi:hypothetical protein
VLLDLGDQHRLEAGGTLGLERDLDGVVDVWKLLRRELDVHHRADDLDDLADCHCALLRRVVRSQESGVRSITPLLTPDSWLLTTGSVPP